MQAIGGTIKGTGAALYVGIGFIPDEVVISALDTTDAGELRWTSNMARNATQEEGIVLGGATLALTRLAHGAGIAAFLGGNQISSTQTAYLLRDESPNKIGDVSTWTLDTSANRTGHFDEGVSTSTVGPGSVVIIKETIGTREPTVVAITAITNDGDAADEITLNKAVNSGDVYFIGGMYDFIAATSGQIMPDGFVINDTSHVNVDGKVIAFTAIKYDD